MLKKLMKLAVAPALLVAPEMAAAADRVQGIMYKNPGCECCDGHADALRRAGIDIRVVASENLAALKARAGVPAELQGCHTVLIGGYTVEGHVPVAARSEEHTSELQSLMRISYAVFCLKKKKQTNTVYHLDRD